MSIIGLFSYHHKIFILLFGTYQNYYYICKRIKHIAMDIHYKKGNLQQCQLRIVLIRYNNEYKIQQV